MVAPITVSQLIPTSGLTNYGFQGTPLDQLQRAAELSGTIINHGTSSGFILGTTVPIATGISTLVGVSIAVTGTGLGYAFGLPVSGTINSIRIMLPGGYYTGAHPPIGGTVMVIEGLSINVLEAASMLQDALQDGDFSAFEAYLDARNYDYTGSVGDDEFEGGNLSDAIHGGAGNDTLSGQGGADRMDGEAGADLMKGGAGNDVYSVDNVGDVVDEAGVSGRDTVNSYISFSLAPSTKVKGYLEDLVLLGTAANGTGNGLNNTIAGTNFANVLKGGGGNDTLYASVGKDTLDGGTGADLMMGGLDDDRYYVDNVGDVVNEAQYGNLVGGDPNVSGTGVDTVYASISFSLANAVQVTGAVENLALLGAANLSGAGNALNNVLSGNTGNNVLRGGAGKDLMIGYAGNDYLDGGTDADTMRGGAGNDTYLVDNSLDTVDETGGSGVDTVYASVSFSLAPSARAKGLVENLVLTGSAAGGSGNELANAITGNAAANALYGAGGADKLNGAAGNDALNGGAGDDTLIGGAGGDRLIGGTGSDTVSYGNALKGVTASLASPGNNKGDAAGDTFSSIENLTGTARADTLTGNGAANILKGAGGGDKLSGGLGKDKLFAGGGADKLTGGKGADNFVFVSVKDSATKAAGRDVILDFNRSQADKINLYLIDANTRKAGNQKFSFIGDDGFGKKAGELRYDKASGDTFVYGDVNGDGRADFSIRIDKLIDLKAADFLL